MINKVIRCTTVLDVWKCAMRISMKFFNIVTRQKLSNSLSNLFHTLLYTILHRTDDSIVPVLRNKALNFIFNMYLKEGLYTLTIWAQYLIYFLRLIFFAVETTSEFRKNSIPQKKTKWYGKLRSGLTLLSNF